MCKFFVAVGAAAEAKNGGAIAFFEGLLRLLADDEIRLFRRNKLPSGCRNRLVVAIS